MKNEPFEVHDNLIGLIDKLRKDRRKGELSTLITLSLEQLAQECYFKKNGPKEIAKNDRLPESIKNALSGKYHLEGNSLEEVSNFVYNQLRNYLAMHSHEAKYGTVELLDNGFKITPKKQLDYQIFIQ